MEFLQASVLHMMPINPPQKEMCLVLGGGGGGGERDFFILWHFIVHVLSTFFFIIRLESIPCNISLQYLDMHLIKRS